MNRAIPSGNNEIKLTRERFDGIYIAYFSRLCSFARTYVLSDETAENIVQNVFLFLWEKHYALKISTSISTYLYTLVKNKCIDHLRHQRIAQEYRTEQSLKLAALEQLDTELISGEDLEKTVMAAIDRLPAKCREIFILSRVEGKKYREISQLLGISVNTVENQMSIALRKLRKDLEHLL
ncbi:MAG: RNA polymerase sigma-70 factor [Bacteroidales bacterium]|nr:RNA polymerase sigma-70 factor [Bacteroidales bacterium]MDD2831081.1 RNA polymerase sigma-70 factor [Bacteroidales bacterium]MDD4167148.1 RNA polymerase sigma-70 factor [Bacteroidales bacterium]MDD4472684.1 RNA polymerase sigma-70 factor [Bacteroidales bacterium]MDD5516089.1 RNA polymerase sigma-70 factor [Bacteroidales bacterium]